MSYQLKNKINDKSAKICAIGLGYVGLPTSILFAQKGFQVVGCDKKADLVKSVNGGKSPRIDLQFSRRVAQLVKTRRLQATTDIGDGMKGADIIIIMVDTTIDNNNNPDLRSLISAGKEVSKALKRDQLVVLVSTVPFGATEAILEPILEQTGLKAGRDFGLAYCPERYNPGDRKHSVDKVTRIISGINEEWASAAELLYRQISKTYLVGDIRTAEMVKLVENAQRDLNIAFINEISTMCEKLNLDVIDVLNAASTKWNFHSYHPGGVGGHCLSKDSWYLTKAAEREDYLPEVVVMGRRINEKIPLHIMELLELQMKKAKLGINGLKVAILGLSYKENIGDTRNSASLAVIEEIKKMGGRVISIDPYIDEKTTLEIFSVDEHYRKSEVALKGADAIILMTAHKDFKALDFEKIRQELRTPIIIDVIRALSSEKMKKLGYFYSGLGRT